MTEVLHWDEKRDGALTEAALRRKLESLGYRSTTYVYSPGTSFPPHAHDIDKLDAVLSGTFRIVLEGRVLDLGPGDAAYVPRGARHSAEVIGDERVVSLDGVRVTR